MVVSDLPLMNELCAALRTILEGALMVAIRRRTLSSRAVKEVSYGALLENTEVQL